jgi:glycosyltransferase involved in cell wall biosynthesis
MAGFDVSVIIPNYNNERFLKQCINSVLSQTYPISQIIVYDDCSTDSSREILREYENSFPLVTVLYGEKNVGVSIARDLAIKAADSDYICILDADDYFYDSYKIENEMNTVKEYYRITGRKCIAFSQTIDVDLNGNPLIYPKHRRLGGMEAFKIITRAYNRYMPRDYCMPKEYYERSGGYQAGLSLYEDWDLNIRLLQISRFLYSGSYGTAYRHKQSGLSAVDYHTHFMLKKKIFNQYKINLWEKIVFYLLLYGAYVKHHLKGR